MAGLGEAERVVHLLRRAGFGGSPAEVAAAQRQGLAATLDRLLNWEQVPDATAADLGAVEPEVLDLHNLHDAQVWWLYRMVRSPRPLLEKLTLFWHGHFATANSKVADPSLMVRQNQTLRHLAGGRFVDLLLAIYRDPAMLIWLDGDTNRKGAPNENFARENMELFTMGLGTYTQHDVHEASRAFTGWVLRQRRQAVFVPARHDSGTKTFLGRTGPWNGGDIMRLLAAEPAAARFIGAKLFAFFAYDNPEPAVVDALAGVYRNSGGDIRAVLRAIFSGEAFYSERALFGRIKSPVELAVGTLRQTGAQYDLQRLPALLARMGQELFNPPNVGGWTGGPAWINAATVHTHFEFARTVVQPEQGSRGAVDVEALLRQAGVTAAPAAVTGADAQALVDFVTSHLLAPQVGPQTRGALRAAAARVASAPRRERLPGLRGLVHLMLVAPEYRLA